MHRLLSHECRARRPLGCSPVRKINARTCWSMYLPWHQQEAYLCLSPGRPWSMHPVLVAHLIRHPVSTPVRVQYNFVSVRVPTPAGSGELVLGQVDPPAVRHEWVVALATHEQEVHRTLLARLAILQHGHERAG